MSIKWYLYDELDEPARAYALEKHRDNIEEEPMWMTPILEEFDKVLTLFNIESPSVFADRDSEGIFRVSFGGTWKASAEIEENVFKYSRVESMLTSIARSLNTVSEYNSELKVTISHAVGEHYMHIDMENYRRPRRGVSIMRRYLLRQFTELCNWCSCTLQREYSELTDEISVVKWFTEEFYYFHADGSLYCIGTPSNAISSVAT